MHLIHSKPLELQHNLSASSLLHYLLFIPLPTIPRSTEKVQGFGYKQAPSAIGSSSEAPIADVDTPISTAPPGSADTGTGSADTTEGSSGGEETDTSWWIAAAAGAGVGLGVLAIGGLLFVTLGKRNRKIGDNAGAGSPASHGVPLSARRGYKNVRADSGYSSSGGVRETKQEPA